MKLTNKKKLAVRTLGLGSNRIIFNPARLDEIKEAITKQDIRDLVSSNAILIKEKKGIRKIRKRKSRRRAGSIRMKVVKGKQHYVSLVRKLRLHVKQLKKKGKLNRDDYLNLRKEIKAGAFKDLTHLRERIEELATSKTHTEKLENKKQ